jgi:hypothetical protein
MPNDPLDDLGVRYAIERGAILTAYQRYHDEVRYNVPSIQYHIQFLDFLQGRSMLQGIKRAEKAARSVLKIMLGFDTTVDLPGERSDVSTCHSFKSSVHYAHYAAIGDFLKQIRDAILRIERWICTTYPRKRIIMFFVDGEYLYTDDHGWSAYEARPVFKGLSNVVHNTSVEDLVNVVHFLDLDSDSESEFNCDSFYSF